LEERTVGGGEVEVEVEVSGEIAREAAEAALKDMKTCESYPTSASTAKMRSEDVSRFLKDQIKLTGGS
jgi:hypothetical protein